MPETIKGNAGRKPGWIIEMAPYDVSVNVVFLAGGDLEPPPPPLGTTDRTRYLKVTSLEGVRRRPELHEWRAAGRTPGWMSHCCPGDSIAYWLFGRRR